MKKIKLNSLLIILSLKMVNINAAGLTPYLRYNANVDNTLGVLYLDPLSLSNNDYKEITHTLVSRDKLIENRYVRFGFNQNGGGYQWSAKLYGYSILPNGFELGEPGYGKGFLGAIRDRYHHGKYNPEQAGRNDYQGVKTKALYRRDRYSQLGVFVPQFPVGLYVDGSSGTNPPLINSKLPEKSAFDFSSFSYDSSVKYRVPALTHEEYWTFARYPRGIASVGINWKNRVKDISPSLSGNQTPSPMDFSVLSYTLRGMRPSRRFRYLHFIRNNRIHTIDINKLSKNTGLDCLYTAKFGSFKRYNSNRIIKPVNNTRCSVDFPLIMFSTSSEPSLGVSMGIYIPMQDNLNDKQVKGVKPSNGGKIFEEDRFMQMTFKISKEVKSLSSSGHYRFVAARTFISGLMSPQTAVSSRGHRRQIRESLTGKSVFLVGTSQQIYDSVKMNN